eukprot:COSAG01_NODE_4543_length_4934_cov_36.451499_6_plen_97_part_00
METYTRRGRTKRRKRLARVDGYGDHDQVCAFANKLGRHNRVQGAIVGLLLEPRAWKPLGLTAPKNELPLAAAPRHPRPAKSALRVSSLVAYTVAGL